MTIQALRFAVALFALLLTAAPSIAHSLVVLVIYLYVPAWTFSESLASSYFLSQPNAASVRLYDQSVLINRMNGNVIAPFQQEFELLLVCERL